MVKLKKVEEMKNSILKKIISAFLLLIIASSVSYTQQIEINRISKMPDFPTPYEMRDWRKTAVGYDSLVFNQNLQGQYLPLIFFRTNTINYPSEPSFGLHTVVGTNSPESGEAINVIPAVVGATLVGIDKSDQNGKNWVKMCREFFNKRPEENVYLNHPAAESGDDWWYATMPNVFFYQLYDLYPETEDFEYQLRSVADQWLKAVVEMNASATPWQIPNMNYRGWYLSTMEPYLSGVKEPEAAGAIAWILYNAYKETKEEKYRIGAEWSMEFLNGLFSNPSYELQLPYGVLTAAKMNTELLTNYDIEKMINWCFDIGPLRSWGATVGNWGGFDISGLIGEVNGVNDYAFLMNTFEHAAALVPLVKYDERFANSVGKWILNAANAARLFYTNYLPDNKQDSEEWSHQYDPNSYIAHEALRQSKYGVSPYATGDAIDGGWGETNLSLYSSSHVGMFGGIIDTTNVQGILKLDLNKTDFFNYNVFPTFLVYNPYDEEKTVIFNSGNETVDIYESISNSIIISGKRGNIQLTIPGNESLIISLIPSGSILEYQLNKILVNNFVLDYNSGRTVTNFPPRVKSLAAISNRVVVNDTIKIYCTAVDLDNDSLKYSWFINNEIIDNNYPILEWQVPSVEDNYLIKVLVEDPSESKDEAEITIEVKKFLNNPPEILNINADPRKIDLGSRSKISCEAIDIDGDSLIYEWDATNGSLTGTGKNVSWLAPVNEGNYSIHCIVNDNRGGVAEDSILVAVRDLSIIPQGELISFYPFNGNAEDAADGNNGIVHGAGLTKDRFGYENKAYFFDGVSNYINVPNHSSLNLQKAITVNFWMKINRFYEREQYPISHGNWERRWKISISGDKLRWTIKTSTGISDLDSETIFEKNKNYNVTALYNGTEMELYINGKLDAFKYWTGDIEATDYDLTIAQAAPNENQYNFNGILDDIRIYDYPLSISEIAQLYDIETSVDDLETPSFITKNFLFPNYPNPFNSETKIKFQINEAGRIILEIYDFLGRKISTLMDEEKTPGIYNLKWNGKNSKGTKISSGIYFLRIRTNSYLSSIKMIMLN